MTNKKPLLSKEVLEAMELLRLEIFMLDDDYVKTVDPRFLVSTCRSFRIKAQNLLNALDSQFNHKTRDKEVCLSDGDIKQHRSLLDRVERLERIIGGKNE